jgi:uracil-DNA glycosylase
MAFSNQSKTSRFVPAPAVAKTPAPQEAAACLHWLKAGLARVPPGAVIALGATAVCALLGRTVAEKREHGR